MISAEDEQLKTGSGSDFVDAVSIDFCDSQGEICGSVRLARLPGQDRSRATVALFIAGELIEQIDAEPSARIDDWADAALDGVRMTTESPLERWTLSVSGERASLQLEASTASAAHSAGEEIAEASGLHMYEQVCEVRGSMVRDGETRQIAGHGRRVHWWGEPAWDRVRRLRTLFAVSDEGRSLSVVGALPTSSDGHADELRNAKVLGIEDLAEIEDVRVSTVYGDDGYPAKASLELWAPESELPRRFGGDSVCATRTERREHIVSLAFFRWLVEGSPAYGAYEVFERRSEPGA